MTDPRRLAMLEEMGLGPVWRLRSASADAPVQDETPAAVVTAREPVAVPRPSARAQMPPAAAPTPSRDRAATVPGRDRTVVPPPRPAAAPITIAPERLADIAGMDWAALRTCVADCTACGLARTRNNTVFGVGAEQADWLIVGEAPGAEEDARGEPFVGQAGRLLDNMLAAVGRSRAKDVYIANVLKCRPPGNRNPEPMEVAQCSPFLVRQIELARPKLILAMGRFAAQTLLGTDASIASLRGRVHRYHGLPCVVTYHPAYLLRNLADKAKAWEDLCFARRVMTGLQTGAAPQT